GKFRCWTAIFIVKRVWSRVFFFQAEDGIRDAREEGRQQPPGEGEPALIQSSGRPGQDDCAEDLLPKLDRLGESEQTRLAARQSELELDAIAGQDPVEVEDRARQQREGGRRASGEEIDSLRTPDVINLVPG